MNKQSPGSGQQPNTEQPRYANSFFQLFSASLKIQYRNWRGLFWIIILPLALYVALSLLKISSVGGQTINYSAYLLPGILAMTIMQTGIFSLAYWLIDLRQRGIIKRFMATPLSRLELVAALISVRILIMFVQLVMLSLTGIYFFGAQINGSIIAIMILTIIGGAIFLSLGFFISNIANSYDEAAPITTALNLLFTFLGNIFFPTSFFPQVLRGVSQILPITYLAHGIRNNFIYNISFRDSLGDIFALLVWLGIVFGITVWSFNTGRD